MDDKNLIYKSDCKHFLGHIPCKPNKKYGAICNTCEYYEPKKSIILIIKLAAMGDVIRTTPLLHKIWQEYPDSEVWWVTDYPDVIPQEVNKVFEFNEKSLLIFQNMKFDTVINLDKDYEASALMKSIDSENKIGFTLENGKPAPIDENARHKFLTGLFDQYSKENEKSYPQEIYEICGWEYEKQEYIFEKEEYLWDINPKGKKLIGLNTGCGDRWTSRILPDSKWIKLIRTLKENRYYPLLLGGKQEHYKNEYLADATGAKYLGHFPIKKFASLVSQCDAVVSTVTMAAHIAIATKVPLVLINNIFNPNEFELYGRGEIIEPTKKCQCYFSPECTNKDYSCIEYIDSYDLYEAVKRAARLKVTNGKESE